MAIGAVTPVHIGVIDKSGELSGTMFNFAPIEDDGSNVDSLFTSVGNAYDVLKLVYIDLTWCNLTRSIASIIVDESSPTLPSNAAAQRELAARFTYIDTVTGSKYTFSIPGPQSTIIQAGTDEISLANLAVAAFVTAFELYCLSPVGNPVEVQAARLVGRNS